MCGITGLANFNQAVSLEKYYPSHLSLSHRGKDDEGFFVLYGNQRMLCRGNDTIPSFGDLAHIQQCQAANLVMGYRRLAIIDLSPGGHQPMQDGNARYIIVYNGEIYNYIELRHELEGWGQHFKTQSDTEVLLAAFIQWGLGCFNRLNGMWAAAIYDTQDKRLLLSRDRFGVKPLYYTVQNDTLIFGSEVKFLLPFLPEMKVNEERAKDFLVHNLVDHHQETIFSGICQLKPAHVAIWERNKLTLQRYWRLPDVKRYPTLEDACQQLNELLLSSVTLRLRSDVPIGSLLSGGLDSTTLVFLVHQLLENAGARNSFEFFSAVFHEEKYSEKKYIEETVSKTGMPVHWIYPNPEKISEELPRLFYHQEFPFRSLSVYSQWEIMKHVATTPVIVLLNGQGSDEVFAGYTAHYFALIAEYIRRMRLDLVWREARSLAEGREIPLMRGIAGALREIAKASPARILVQNRRIPYLTQRYQEIQEWERRTDIFENALVRNLTFSALPEYLRYEDRNSMAFTLESRLPFMDYRLVEWAISLPAEFKIKGTASKVLLREVARPLIPESIYNRKDKMGFVSPQEIWQRSNLAPLLDKTFAQELQDRFPFLDARKCRQMYTNYQQGNNDEWTLVWRIANLAWWHQYWWKDLPDPG